MAERALRGSRLGAQSYETDLGVEMAPRQSVTYDCPRDHRFTIPFSLEADVPDVWECTVCGADALRVDGTRPEPKAGKPARTHWDMLLERRSVKDLEVLPRRWVEHRGVTLEEMDVDAILRRRPQVCIVDELAHTNVPGSPHAKRYEDVLTILEAGIHVMTAVNIQHLETLNYLPAEPTLEPNCC